MAELTLIVRRMFRSPPAKVFEAWTTPDRLRIWWGPGNVTCPTAEVDLRPGGSYRLANQLPDGNVVWIVGTFEAVEPPSLLIYSWRTEPGSSITERVTVQFLPRGEGTEVVIVHQKVPDKTSYEVHQGGWVGCLDKLEALIDG